MDYEMKQNFEAAIPIFGEMHKHYQNHSDWNLRLARARQEEGIRRGKQETEMKRVGILVAVIIYAILGLIIESIFGSVKFGALILILAIGTFAGVKVNGIVMKKFQEQPFSPEFIQQETTLNQNMQSELNAVKQIYADNWELIEYFPNDYRYSYAIEQIYKILLNGRADSMKEALNIFEEDCHRRRMEQQLAQILQMQMELCGYLIEISSEVYQLRQQMNQMQNKNGGIW